VVVGVPVGAGAFAGVIPDDRGQQLLECRGGLDGVEVEVHGDVSRVADGMVNSNQ
jgi:hypothetical protein